MNARKCYKDTSPARKRRGFTLVELLVVIAIIGVLVALLLPAIQAAREAARRNTCKNNVKQLALGWMNHESSVKHFPTGGWGWKWFGDADRGTGASQPGGWIYNILPYIEQQAMHNLPSDGKPDVVTQQQRDGALQLTTHPFNTIQCPSRAVHQGEIHHDTAYENLGSLELGSFVEVTDYVASSGDRQSTGLSDGKIPKISGNNMPANPTFCVTPNGEVTCGTESALKLPPEYWITVSAGEDPFPNMFNGVCFNNSLIKLRHIPDGTTNTYMIGEKWSEHEEDDAISGAGSNHSWAIGGVNDNLRSSAYAPLQNANRSKFTGRVVFTLEDRLGGPHSGGFVMGFCDGHVELVSFEIDLRAHQLRANRLDGQVIGQ